MILILIFIFCSFVGIGTLTALAIATIMNYHKPFGFHKVEIILLLNKPFDEFLS